MKQKAEMKTFDSDFGERFWRPNKSFYPSNLNTPENSENRVIDQNFAAATEESHRTELHSSLTT
jgi:hypothetical protein